jgi:hypothetical protein
MIGVELYGQVQLAVYVEGLSRRLSRRETARQFGMDPRPVAKMLAFSVPPGYRRLGLRRGRSWTRSWGSSIRFWKRITARGEGLGTACRVRGIARTVQRYYTLADGDGNPNE